MFLGVHANLWAIVYTKKINISMVYHEKVLLWSVMRKAVKRAGHKSKGKERGSVTTVRTEKTRLVRDP